VKDAFGREIFLEQLPPALLKQKVQRSEHQDVPGSKQRPWAGGGAPTIFISDLVAHMNFPQAWMIDSNWAPVRLEHVRMEGSAGVLRVTARGMRNGRFNDMLIDVNSVTTGNVGGYAIEYHKGGPIYFIGSTFEGPVGLGQNTICYSVGARFHNRQRKMSGFIREGDKLPEGSFFRHTGQQVTIPYRRWKGERIIAGTHERIGFVQLPGTSGARVHEMNESHEMSVNIPAGEKSVVVKLEDLQRQPDSNYRVLITPGWRAGAVWISDKQPFQYTINFDEPAPKAGGTMDVFLNRAGFRGKLKP